MKSRSSSGMEASIFDAHHRAQAALLQQRPRTRAPGPRPLPRSRRRSRAIRRNTPCASTSQPGNRWSRNSASMALQRDEAALGPARRPCVGGRQLPEARHLGRHRHQGVERRGRRRRAQLQRQGEAEVGDEGEGVGRVDGQRRQHREQLARGTAPPAARARRCVTSSASTHASGPRRPARSRSVAPARLLVVHQVGGGGVDPRRAARPGVRPSWLSTRTPSRTWPFRPATRTM